MGQTRFEGMVPDNCEVIESFLVRKRFRKRDPRYVVLQPRNLKEAAAFMDRHSMDAVELNHILGFKAKDLAVLRELTVVRHLDIILPKLTRGKDLLALHELRSLTIEAPLRNGLDFSAFPELVDFRCDWRDGYDSIWKCRKLRSVDLTGFQADTLDGIEACQQIRWLRLAQSRLISLKPISALTHLRGLKLMALERLRDIDELRQLELEDLEVYRCPRVESWASLAQQPKLRRAELNGPKRVRAREWRWPELRELKLYHVEPIDTLAWLARSKKLEELWVGEKTRVTDGDFHWIRHCPRLSVFEVDVPKGARYSPAIEQIQAVLSDASRSVP